MKGCGHGGPACANVSVEVELREIDLINFIFHKLETLCVSKPSVISFPNYRVQFSF